MKGDEFVAQVDLAYPDRRMAIELDSFRHHDVRTSFDRERARGNDVESLWWDLLRVTDDHIKNQRERVVRWLKASLGSPRGATRRM